VSDFALEIELPSSPDEGVDLAPSPFPPGFRELLRQKTEALRAVAPELFAPYPTPPLASP
jgi:hypothetical protein